MVSSTCSQKSTCPAPLQQCKPLPGLDATTQLNLGRRMLQDRNQTAVALRSATLRGCIPEQLCPDPYLKQPEINPGLHQTPRARGWRSKPRSASCTQVVSHIILVSPSKRILKGRLRVTATLNIRTPNTDKPVSHFHTINSKQPAWGYSILVSSQALHRIHLYAPIGSCKENEASPESQPRKHNQERATSPKPRSTPAPCSEEERGGCTREIWKKVAGSLHIIVSLAVRSSFCTSQCPLSSPPSGGCEGDPEL